MTGNNFTQNKLLGIVPKISLFLIKKKKKRNRCSVLLRCYCAHRIVYIWNWSYSAPFNAELSKFFLRLKGFSQAKRFSEDEMFYSVTKQPMRTKNTMCRINPFFCCRANILMELRTFFFLVKVTQIILNLAQFQTNQTKTKSPSKHCWHRYTYKIIPNRIFIVLNCLFYWLLNVYV